jgi:uncharacterized MnhB-related membrane protein
MGKSEKVALLILLLLLLLIFAFIAKKFEDQEEDEDEEGQGGWGISKPPPIGPGGASDADVMYNEYKPILGAMLFEAALEAAGELENKLDNGKQEIEQKIEAQNETDSKINSEIDTDIKTQIETAVEAAFNQAFQMQMNLISDAKVLSENQLQTAIQTAVNAAVESAFETALAFGDVRALTENQLQTAVQTAVNSAVESAFESSLKFGDVRALAENQLQTAVQTAVNSAVESAFESSLAFGDVRALAENQLQTAIQTAVNSAVESAFESSLNFGDVRALAENQLQTAVQTAVNSAVESAFESSLNFGDVRALAENQLQTAIQTAVNSAVESAFESSLNFGDVRALAENQLQTAIQTAVNSAVESAFESSLNFGDVRALAESQLQTAVQSAVNSAVESAFESSLAFGDVRALAENQLQSAVQTAVNSAVESAFESSLNFGDVRALAENQLQTAIQTAVNSAVESTFESSLNFGDVRALAENQLQTAIQSAVNSAVESVFESSLNFGDVRALAENQLQTAIQTAVNSAVESAFESSLNFGDVRALAENQLQTAIQTAVNSAVESAFESSLNFGDVRALAENQLQTAVQAAVNSAVESAFESSLKFGDVRALAENQLQTAVQAAVNSAVESAFESSLNFGDVRALAENQLQTAVQAAINSAVESAFEASLKFGDTRALTESQLQTAIQTAVNSAVESAFESSLKFGDVRALAENQLQTAIQSAINSAVESAFESSLKFGDTQALTENLRANLESIKTQLEQKLQKYMENRARGNPKMKYQLNASCAIARIVMGTPKIDEQGKVDYEAALQVVFKGNKASAFGHRPKKYLQLRVPQVWKDLVKQVNKVRAQVKKNVWLPGSKAVESIMESSVGKPIFNVVDKIDRISDRLEIVTLFSDALFYDPDYSALSWDPLLPATFKSIGQKMINKQLEYIKTYNEQNVPDDRYPFDTAQYPLIAGPLDLIDVVAGTPAYQQSRGDPEYNRYRIQTMLDVVRESLLSDPSTVHHIALLNSTAFNGVEADMQVTISDPTDKLVFYIDDNMTCQDADNLYAEAYTSICTYEGGVVYEDTYEYTDSKCPTYKRRRFQCGFANKAACRNAGDIWMNSYGQAGNYGEWMNMKTIKDTREPVVKDVVNEASTILRTNGGFACVITGSGLRAVCNESGGTYEFNTKDEPVCTFTPAVCQSFGTCSATAEDGTTYCELPPSLQGAQMFFGQQLPREWVRIHGCHFGRNIHDIGSFASVLTSFGAGGKTFFQDMLANKANHKKGLENTFLGPDALDTWLSLSTIIGPAILLKGGVGSPVIMVVIFIIVGSMMAAQAIRENRRVSQTNVDEPAEYTVGGWTTTSTTVSSDVFTIESATMTSATIQQNHDFIIGDSVSLIGLRWTNGTTPEIRLPEIKVTVATVPSTKDITFTSLQVTLPGFQNFVESKGYVRKTDAAADQVDYAEIKSRPGRKVLKGVGYTDGWITKPLMPKDASGTTLPTSAAITSVAGVVEKPFYVDVDPNGKAYPDGQSCYGPAIDAHYASFFTSYQNFKLSDWRTKFDNETATMQAEFDAKLSEAQARFDSLSSQRDEIKNACTGINFFTKCGPALVKAARGSLDAALDSLENLINEAAEDVKKYAEMAADVVKQFFETFGNYIKKMFEDAEKLMKFSATLAVSDLTGRCVDSRINMNFRIGKFIGDLSKDNQQLSKTILKSTFGQIPGAGTAIDKMCDGIEFFGQKILKGGVKCVVTGKINDDLDAFTEECYKIVAVDSATGTIASPGKGLKTHTDNWMDKSEYKRLCSNLPTPMIHAWAAPLGNKLWCLPPQPPSSWANANIGTLTPIETAFRVNRSWTNFADGVNEFFEDYPTFPRKVMEQTPSESLPRTGTAQNWYYQLVYSKDDFNLDNLWNDTLLSQHFSLSTISQMRIEYCTDFFFGNDERNIPEDLTGKTVNPKCWGYLSFAMTGYSFMPMTILSKTNTALTGSIQPAYYTPASGFNN